MPRRIESPFLAGPAGRLEALLEGPENAPPREAALVCHPHPQHGGTMHNKVVYRIARALRRAGFAVLRFNYRGVNLSAGEYANGVGELEDTRSALAFLREKYPSLPCTLAGFSFGSRIILKLGCEPGVAARLIAVGFPAASAGDLGLGRCDVPRIIVQSTHDQFGPIAATQAWFDSLPEPKRLIWVEAQDHFFAGALDQFEEAVFSAVTA